MSVKDRARRHMDRQKHNVQQQHAAVDGFNAILQQLSRAASEARESGQLSAQDLYGEAIDAQNRNVRQGANSMREALGRLSLAGGRGPSGSDAASMLRIGEQANRQTGDFRRSMEQLADRRRMGEQGREAQLLSQLLGGRGALMNRADQRFDLERMHQLQRRQANRQFFTDMLSLGFNVAGAAAGGGGG